jgi:predicted ATP-grasp superfamily ATP-dependent carboligase
MTALVFNCAYNGLSIIQELGRRGVDVHALDSFRNVGTTSKYATYHACPNPTADEEAFVSFLLNLAPTFDETPVLIPTNDHWASAVASHRERLADHYHPCVADGETVERLLDKQAFADWATERDYPVPRSWQGDDIVGVPEDAFPIAGKPGDARDAPDMMYRSTVVSLWNRLTNGSAEEPDADLAREAELYEQFRLAVFDDREELDTFRETYPDLAADFVFQEYVRGDSDSMYTVGVFANEGEVKGLFTGRKVRGYPPDIGDCKVGQAESVPDHLVETTRRMCADLDYHGIAEFEFKRDVETGEYWLIEVNPRSWSWVGITPACGVSLPWMAYAECSGRREFAYTESSVTDGEVTWVKASEDLFNSLLFYRESKPSWSRDPVEWWQSLDADRLVFAEGLPDDPLPVAYAVALAGRRLGLATLDGLKARM